MRLAAEVYTKIISQTPAIKPQRMLFIGFSTHRQFEIRCFDN